MATKIDADETCWKCGLRDYHVQRNGFVTCKNCRIVVGRTVDEKGA